MKLNIFQLVTAMMLTTTLAASAIHNQEALTTTPATAVSIYNMDRSQLEGFMSQPEVRSEKLVLPKASFMSSADLRALVEGEPSRAASILNADAHLLYIAVKAIYGECADMRYLGPNGAADCNRRINLGVTSSDHVKIYAFDNPYTWGAIPNIAQRNLAFAAYQASSDLEKAAVRTVADINTIAAATSREDAMSIIRGLSKAQLDDFFARRDHALNSLVGITK